MPSNSYPLVAREGWLLIGILSVLILLIYFIVDISYAMQAIPVIIFFLFLLRDPPRDIPSLPLALLCPAHGKVMAVETIDDPWIKRKATRIRLKMSFFDIYSLRSPVEGKVMNQWALRPCEEFPDRNFVLWIKTDEGDDVVMETHLNLLTAFIFRFYVHSGERIGQGQRCGFLYFGGLIDVWVPDNCKISVQQGQKINSGSDVLAYLVHTDSSIIPPEETGKRAHA